MTDLLWHFAGPHLRDGSPLPKAGHVSDWIEHIEPCAVGWHASERAIDALQYAPGPYVARVRLHGATISHGNPIDKLVGQQRETVSDYVDATAALRLFAQVWDLAWVDQFPTGSARSAAGQAAKAAMGSWGVGAAKTATRASIWAAEAVALANACNIRTALLTKVTTARADARAEQNTRLEDLLTRCIDAKETD